MEMELGRRVLRCYSQLKRQDCDSGAHRICAEALVQVKQGVRGV